MTTMQTDLPSFAPSPAPPASPTDSLLTAAEVARWLGISERTVWRYTKEGLLPAPVRSPSRRTRWSEQAIRRHLDRLAQEL